MVASEYRLDAARTGQRGREHPRGAWRKPVWMAGLSGTLAVTSRPGLLERRAWNGKHAPGTEQRTGPGLFGILNLGRCLGVGMKGKCVAAMEV